MFTIGKFRISWKKAVKIEVVIFLWLPATRIRETVFCFLFLVVAFWLNELFGSTNYD